MGVTEPPYAAPPRVAPTSSHALPAATRRLQPQQDAGASCAGLALAFPRAAMTVGGHAGDVTRHRLAWGPVDRFRVVLQCAVLHHEPRACVPSPSRNRSADRATRSISSCNCNVQISQERMPTSV